MLVGRPVLFGLASDGEAGARTVLELLRDELLRGLALLGCTRPEYVVRAHVQPAVTYHSPG